MRHLLRGALVVALAIAAAGCHRKVVVEEHGGGGGGGGGGGWERLGTRSVDHRGDHDTIMADFQGDFTAIKIEVDRTELEMYNVRVNFGNGEHWSPDTRFEFREGTWSRTIDLPGGVRHIRSIDFWYRTEHRGEGKAIVTAWGRH
jgi:hypothetical protein